MEASRSGGKEPHGPAAFGVSETAGACGAPKKKNLKIHYWVLKGSPELLQATFFFLSKEPHSEQKRVMPREDVDSKLFNKVSSNFLKFLTGTSAYHLPCRELTKVRKS